jgi:hypothetical protein
MPIFAGLTYLEKSGHFEAAKSQFNISDLEINSKLIRSIDWRFFCG